MKKTIAALLLSLMPLMAMEIEEHGINTYPNEKPKSKCVFSVDLSPFHIWEDEERLNRKTIEMKMGQNCDEIKTLFKKLNFIAFPHYVYANELSQCDLFFGNMSSKRLKSGLYIHIQYRKKSRAIGFETFEHKFIKEPISVLSWRWVNYSAHKNFLGVSDYLYLGNSNSKERLRKKMKRMIEKNGLENSFTRLVVVIGSDHYYSFSVLFKTEEEKEKGTIILKKLEKNMKNTLEKLYLQQSD
jgi:hypothetical protein